MPLITAWFIRAAPIATFELFTFAINRKASLPLGSGFRGSGPNLLRTRFTAS
jgi:hypothetical protein